MQKKIAVLIPCYNERATVAQVVAACRGVLPEAEIYVYDNNSTDGTDAEARRAGAIVRYERRQGKGSVVRAMFRDIDADCYVLADGDAACEVDALPDMAERVLRGEADMVVGDRLDGNFTAENFKRLRSAGNRVIRAMVNGLFRGDVKDALTGYRAVNRAFAKGFPARYDGYEVETEMTAYALGRGMRVAAVPILYREETGGGNSKLNPLSDGPRILAAALRLCREYRPRVFYGLATAGALLLGALVWVVWRVLAGN